MWRRSLRCGFWVAFHHTHGTSGDLDGQFPNVSRVSERGVNGKSLCPRQEGRESFCDVTQPSRKTVPGGKLLIKHNSPVVVRRKENGGHLSLRFFRLFAVSLDEEMIAQSVGNLSPTIRLWGLWLLPGRGSLFVRRRDIKQRVAADLVGAPEFEAMLVTHFKVGTGFG